MSRSPESVEPHAELEQLEPLFCIGESHCLRFRGRLYRRPGRTRPLVAHVHFLKDVEATTFTGDGGLHPAVAAALLAAGVLVERPSDDDDAEAGVELEPAHRATTFRRRVLAARHAALADEPLVAPAILLFAGDKELHGLACELDGADFELPQADFEPSRGGGVTRVPFHAVEAAFAARLRPFFDGLAMLREAGFTRTLVHGLMPRCRDDDRVARWCHDRAVPAIVRRKLAAVANRLLAACCRELGFAFVDVDGALASDGYLAARFDLDGIHGNGAATAATLPLIAEALDTLSRTSINEAQYELLAELAPPPPPLPESGWLRLPSMPVPAAHEPLDAALAASVLARHAGPILAARGRPIAGEELVVADAPPGVRAGLWLAHGELTVATDPPVALAAGDCLLLDPVRLRPTVASASADAELLQLLLLPGLPDEPLAVIPTPALQVPADPFRIEGAADHSVLRRWREIPGHTIERPAAVETPTPVG